MENKKTSQISNRPLDPAVDYAEYVGGETDNRAGITVDHTRKPGEDIDISQITKEDQKQIK